MNIFPLSEKEQKIIGDFSIHNDEIAGDLEQLINWVSENVSFSDQKVLFLGFEELLPNEKEDLKVILEKSGISFTEKDGYILVHLSSKEQLTLVMNEWEVAAGGGGLFGLLASNKDWDTAEEMAIESLASQNLQDTFEFFMKDISDGDKNVFLIKLHQLQYPST